MTTKGKTYQLALSIGRVNDNLRAALRQNEFDIAAGLIKTMKGQVQELEKQFNKSMKFRQR